MIFGRNNRNYAKSGEENYRRAMNETIIHYATAANQQSDVYSSLAGGVSSTMTAAFPNNSYKPAGTIVPSDMNLVVDVSAYVDPYAPVYSTASGNEMIIDGDVIDNSTTTNNRYAFFYDFGDYIHLPSGSTCIMRYGYMFVPKNEYSAAAYPGYVERKGPDGSVIGYALYGYYCFNSAHVDEHGDPLSCRRVPYSF
jgi:hypothetical protein